MKSRDLKQSFSLVEQCPTEGLIIELCDEDDIVFPSSADLD